MGWMHNLFQLLWDYREGFAVFGVLAFINALRSDYADRTNAIRNGFRDLAAAVRGERAATCDDLK